MTSRKIKKIIEKSGLFDGIFYLKTYRDARLSSETPLDHYLKYGLIEDRKPNEWFDPVWYRSHYEDIKEAEIHPFVHYLRYGMSEFRFANAEEKREYESLKNIFDIDFYRNAHPDLSNLDKDFDLLWHYVHYGKNEDRKIQFKEIKQSESRLADALAEENKHSDMESIGDKTSMQEMILAVVGIPRSGLTLLSALLGSHPEISPWLLPYSTGRAERVFSDVCELADTFKKTSESPFKSRYILLSETTANLENLSKLFESLSNFTKNGVDVKVLWVIRDINHTFLSQIEAAHRYWGEDNIDLSIDSYKNYINFAINGYQKIVENIIDFENIFINFRKLTHNPEKELTEICRFLNVEYPGNEWLDTRNVERDYIVGDPGFVNFDHIDAKIDERRSAQWALLESDDAYFEKLEEKLQWFVVDYNRMVNRTLVGELKDFVDYAYQEYLSVFDEAYYRSNYLGKEETDAPAHYDRIGWRKGYNPNSWFNTSDYQNIMNDFTSMNPLMHFQVVGKYMVSTSGIIQEEPKRVMEDLVIIDPENYEIAEDLLLEVPKFKEPKVSILIPAYNQQNYTMACIESIIKNTKGVSYEIIVMDDKSPDPDAQEIEAHLKNVKFVVNGVNYGFLRNCNKGAQFAIGEYILFLNNDTNPQPGWLSSLVELIESADDIGMVGSRLVYPTGQQQEAGGIVWQDASAWNFGRLDDPYKPDYNYVKEADYLTGAAMMIRRDVWEEIGGFDERYVPAYYEDTDIAFEVRRRGYRTLYQPRSVVIHFEGISNGTDTGSGVKRYQVINHDKFYEKWKEVLIRDHFPNAQHVFLARDRSRYKKHILFVDHYLPHYDQDAGSKAAYQYLKILAKGGMQVHFIGDNFYDYPGTPYLDALTQLGIEVLYGNWYANHWEDWLEENGAYLDYVMLSRPHIAPKYLEAVKRYTQAKIIYIGHDLHFLRERREYEIKGDVKYLESSEKWKEAEMALIRDADSAWYFSEIEQQIVQNEDPSVSIDVVPLFIYEDFHERSYRAEERQDIMFIGGFDHAPNVDAVVWFVREIWPRFILANPGVHFYIIGSKPKPEILELAGDDITVTGFVSDEELEGFYDCCRMMVAPLRYGAGVKGKVIDALYHGMPLVTTSIGAEGIRGAEKIMAIEDEAESFAQTLNHLYNDPKALERMSAAELNYCRKHFSLTVAKRRMGKVIEEFREDS